MNTIPAKLIQALVQKDGVILETCMVHARYSGSPVLLSTAMFTGRNKLWEITGGEKCGNLRDPFQDSVCSSVTLALAGGCRQNIQVG